MPYTAEHKARTRDRIIAAARLLFNQHGFVDVSIDDVMAEAGLTRGGFYNHFRNKQELLVASIEAYGQCNPTDRWDDVDLDYAGDTVAAQMIDAYLSSAHLEDVAGHCPLVALPADAAHAGRDVLEAYRLLLDRMVGVFAAHENEADSKSLALTAMCVGAMLLGRTVGDREFGERMLAATRQHASTLLSG